MYAKQTRQSFKTVFKILISGKTFIFYHVYESLEYFYTVITDIIILLYPFQTLQTKIGSLCGKKRTNIN